MTQDQPSRLDRLEALLADVGDVVLQNAEVTANHSAALTRIEDALQQLTSRVDVLTTSTTEVLQLVADNSRAIAASNERIAQTNERIARSEERIEQILEYLFRERPNGRGGNQ